MLCVLAKIDPAARTRLLRLQEPIKAFGIPPRHLHGHFTLAAYVGEEEDAFVDSCKTILSGIAPFTVRYDTVEVLEATSILAASPQKDHELARIQQLITNGWSEDLDRWTRPDVWKPHTTLLQAPEVDLQRIASAVRKDFAPFDAWVNEVEFSRAGEKGYQVTGSIVLR